MKKNMTCVLSWILLLWSITAFFSQTLVATPPAIPLRDHPRLLLFKGEENEIKQLIASDPAWKKMHELILKECEVLLKKPDLERKMEGIRLLKVSREMWKRSFYLSYAYRMTGDMKYFHKVERDMLTVSKFSDWNPSHFLDVAEMTMALAIGYDWLFEKLSENSRKQIREAIVHKGLLRSKDQKNYNWWLKVGGNANQVCNSGISMGALAVQEHYPELAQELVDRAFTSLPFALKTYAPDGVYPEGFGYWVYGTTYNVLFLSAIEKIQGTDRGLSAMPGFLQSADFIKHSITPARKNFNWSDQGEWIIIHPAMFWMAQKRGDPSVLWSEKKFLEHPTFRGYENLRELPAVMIWARNTPLHKITEPKEKFWVGQGPNPIAVMRNSWTDPNALYLGFKAGNPTEIHGHMDIGSFIMEADGYRWASDPGTQNYYKTDSMGMNTSSKDPKTERWKVFRYNNHSHNVITINGQLQNPKGYAKIDEYSDHKEFMYALSDLTEAYNGEVKKGLRGVALKDGKYVVIRDEIETLNNGKPTTVRWKIFTYCDIQISDHSAVLTPSSVLEENWRHKGKKLTLKVNTSSKIVMKQWSTTTGKPYDPINKGAVLLGFECTIPAGTRATFEVLLIPEKSTDSATFLNKDLSEWKTIKGNTPVKKLTLDRNTLKLSKGETATLKVIVEPANATNKNVTWRSDAPGIASVNNGQVTAVAAGVATISAQTVDGGLRATCQVTVTDETTGSSEILTPQVHVVPGAVRIFLSYPEPVYIYSIDAQKVEFLLLPAGEHIRALPSGAYVVTIRKESYKIFICNR